MKPLNFFNLLLIVKTLILRFVVTVYGDNCDNYSDCGGLCGVCIYEQREKQITKCIYPFPEVKVISGACVRAIKCTPDYCKNGGTCDEPDLAIFPRCTCDLTKYYGEHCEILYEEDENIQLMTGLSLHTSTTITDAFSPDGRVYIATTSEYSDDYYFEFYDPMSGYYNFIPKRKNPYHCKLFQGKPYLRVGAYVGNCSYFDHCYRYFQGYCKLFYSAGMEFAYRSSREQDVFWYKSKIGDTRGYIRNITMVGYAKSRKSGRHIRIYHEEFPFLATHPLGNFTDNFMPLVSIENCDRHYYGILNISKLSYSSPRKMPMTVQGTYRFHNPPADMPRSLEYNWNLFNVLQRTKYPILNFPNVMKKTGSDNTWTFGRYTLKPAVYRVRLHVINMYSNEMNSNFDACFLRITAEPLKALIEGGDKRVVGNKRPVVIKGDSSYDPNEPRSNITQPHLKFYWSCKPDCYFLDDPYQINLNIPGGRLTVGKTYVFTLKVMATDLEPDFASQTILVVAEGGSGIKCIKNCLSRIVPVDHLVLEITMEDESMSIKNLTWGYNIDQKGMTSADAIKVPNYSPIFLCVKRSVLTEGFQYMFHAIPDNIKFASNILKAVDKRPVNGSCVVTPNEGVFGNTTFNITCSGFQDDETGFTYEYFDKKTTDPDIHFSGRMIFSNVEGYLNDVLLTRGIVYVFIYDVYGIPAVTKSDVVLSPNQITEDEIRVHALEEFVGIGDVKSALNLASELADLMSVGQNISTNMMIRVLNLVVHFPIKTVESMKICLSTIQRIIGVLISNGNYKMELNMVKRTARQVSRLTEIFRIYTVSTDTEPFITSVVVEQITTAFLDVIEWIMLNRNDQYLLLYIDDIDRYSYRTCGHISRFTQQALNNMDYVLSCRQGPGCLGYTVNSTSRLSSISVIRDSVLFLTMEVKKNEVFPVEITPELLQHLRASMTRSSLLTLQTTVLNYNPFWTDRTEVSTNLLSVSLYSLTENKILHAFTFLQKPIELYLNVSKHVTTYLDLEAKRLDPTADLDYLDKNIPVLRLDLPERSKLFLEFYLNVSDELQVIVRRELRPDYQMMNESKIITSSNPVYEVPDFFLDKDTFIYIGVLPGKNVSVGDVVKYKLHFHYVQCLTWKEHYWMPYYCLVGPRTAVNSTTVYCRCNHLSIVSAAIKVPPNRLDPFNDFELFLTLKDNLVPDIIVLLALLVFLILCIWGFWRDRKDLVQREIIILEDNFPGDTFCYIVVVFTGCRFFASSSANIGIKLHGADIESHAHILRCSSREITKCYSDDWFLIRCPTHLGQLDKIHIWHDNSGVSPDWYCNKIIVCDMDTEIAYTFLIGNWLALDDYEHCEAVLFPMTTEQEQMMAIIFLENALYSFRRSHLCISIIARHPRDKFSTIDRTATLLCLLLTTMLVSILIFRGVDQEPDTDLPDYSFERSALFISIITFVISAFIVELINLAFRTAHDKTYDYVQNTIMYHARSMTDTRIRLDTIKAGIRPSEKTMKWFKIRYFHSKWVGVLGRCAMPLPLAPMTSRKTPHKVLVNKRWYMLAWLLIIGVIVCSIVVVTFCGLKLGNEKVKVWITIVALALILHLFVFYPIKVILLHAVLASSYFSTFYIINYNFKKQHVSQEELIGDDKVYWDIIQLRTHPMYKPLTGRKIEYWAKRRMKTRSFLKKVDFTVVFIFILVLCAVIGTILGVDSSWLNLHVKQMVLFKYESFDINFEDIHSTTNFVNYVLGSWTTSLYNVKWYNLISLNPPETEEFMRYWTKDSTMKLLGNPVLRQLRVIQGNCGKNITFKKESRVCIPDLTPDVEDTRDYAFAWSTGPWVEETRGPSSWKYKKPSGSYYFGCQGNTWKDYHDGGFIQELSRRKYKTTRILLTLKDGEWINHLTKVAFVMFTLYNGNLNCFTRGALIAERSVSGLYVKRAMTETVCLTAVDLFLFIIFILILVFCCVRGVLKINRHGLFSYFRSFLNIFETLYIIFGIMSLVYFSIYLVFLARNYDEVRGFFSLNLNKIIYYKILSVNGLLILFCCLALRILLLFKFGRKYSKAYAKLSKNVINLFWLTIYWLLFIWIFKRGLSLLSNSLFACSVQYWQWSHRIYESFNAADRLINLFLYMPTKLYSLIVLCLFADRKP